MQRDSHDLLPCQVLEGDRLVSTAYTIKFGTNVSNADLCSKKLKPAEVKMLLDAVKSDYYFQVQRAREDAWHGYGINQ